MSLPISSPVSRENSSKRSFSVAESSSKTEQPDDKRGSGSFALDVSTLQLESLMERRQVEGNNRDVVPAIAENARSAIPEEEGGKKEWNSLTRPILELDPWNMRKVKMSAGACDVFKGTVRNPMKILRMQKRLDAMKLRNYCPDSVPVAVEKDARSDVPDIDMKKYLVHGDTPLGEFVYFIRVSINYKRPLFVTFKNTKPPLDALMSAIDKENQDKDGFLHMTYRGEKENILENSPGVCLDLAESSFTQECHLNKMQAEKYKQDQIALIVERGAVRRYTPDSGENGNGNCFEGLRNTIVYLDNWNRREYRMAMSSDPTMSDYTRNFYAKRYKQLYIDGLAKQQTCLDGRQLREKRPDYIPVAVEKDARSASDIPDIDVTKYQVPGNMTLGQFVDWIRQGLAVCKAFPVRVFFNNAEPPAGALMSAIDEEYKDEDGFLYMTYSGEERVDPMTMI